MTTRKEFYAPRPLSTSREYPGYQFYAALKLEGRSAGECLCYAALTIQNWLCERIRKADGSVPEAINCPPAARYMEVPPGELKSARLPFSEIISLPDQGVWTLMVREPHPEIAGRAFVTHAGLRVRSGDEVELGVRIDIVDRDRALAEQDKAFRPQFIRLLFETEGMILSQAEPLVFKKYIEIGDKRGVGRLKALADDRENQFPLVVFTHAKRVPPADLEQFVADVMKAPPLPAFGTPPPAERPRLPSGFMPYDPGEFAQHVYGFARAYVVSEKAFPELRAKFSRAGLSEGDILVVEPKAFGGTARKLPYKAGLNGKWYEGLTKELQERLECYSKQKPYSFGGVLFTDDARQLMREQELEALRASFRVEESAEVQRLLAQLEEERATSAEQARTISELRAQNLEEYNRGAESEKERAETLEGQLAKVKEENAALKAANESMRPSFEESRAVREILQRVQTVERMPRDNADVLAYFQRIFADRLGFTERGQKTAAKCGINPEALWHCLYCAATVLVDLYREGVQDVERAFKERTNWELAPKEGAMTRQNSENMNLRKDTYQGREISIEPHIKFPRTDRKTGAQYQRLYYAYDPLSRKVIVGYVGDHLENRLSLSVH